MQVEDLKKRNRFLEDVIDNIPDWFFVKDIDSRHVLMNKAYVMNAIMNPGPYQRIRPKSKNDLMGKTDYEIFIKELADQLRKEDLEAIRKDLPVYSTIYSTHGSDGVKWTVDSKKSLLKDSNGKATHIISTITNITVQKRMEKISGIKDKLRKLPGVSSGLNLILDEALDEFGKDIGAIFMIDKDEGKVRLQAYKSNIEGVELDDAYSLDSDFIELEPIKTGKSLSEASYSQLSILKTIGITSVPIYLGRVLYGILTLGDVKGRVLTKENLDSLNLFGDLASTVFEGQALSVKPTKEIIKKREKKFSLVLGKAYLIKNELEKAYEVFVDQVLSGFEGLCITREPPEEIRKQYRLQKTPIVWLREERAQDETTIHSLQDLSIMINQFLKKSKQGIVLLDGFEYLVVNHGFKPCLKFLQLTRSRFEEKKGIFIASVLEETFDKKEFKLLEREIQPLKVEL